MKKSPNDLKTSNLQEMEILCPNDRQGLAEGECEHHLCLGDTVHE